MSNRTYYYFGAYLEIDVLEVTFQRKFQGCSNGHKSYNNNKYCAECGSRIGVQSEIVTEFPTWIESLIGDKWEDVLSVITPPTMFQTGTIIAAGNAVPGGKWLYLDQWGDEKIQIKEFPTGDEIANMKAEFETNYADIIDALKKCKDVISVKIKAGYVLDQEY